MANLPRIFIFLAFLLCSQLVLGQSIALIDSFAIQSPQLTDRTFWRVGGDTLFQGELKEGYSMINSAGMRKDIKLSKAPRKTNTFAGHFLGCRWIFNISDGYIYDLNTNPAKVWDLWGKTEKYDAMFQGNFGGIHKSAYGDVYYLANGTTDQDFHSNNYYQDSALIRIDPINQKVTKIGRKPGFLSTPRQKQPVFQYWGVTLQDADSVYMAFDGHPSLFRYVAGHLQDSTTSHNGYDKNLIIKPNYYSRVDLDSAYPRYPKSLKGYKLTEAGLHKDGMNVLRFLRKGKTGYQVAIYDQHCRFVRMVPIGNLPDGIRGIQSYKDGIITCVRRFSDHVCVYNFRLNIDIKG